MGGRQNRRQDGTDTAADLSACRQPNNRPLSVGGSVVESEPSCSTYLSHTSGLAEEKGSAWMAGATQKALRLSVQVWLALRAAIFRE
jgi:hypothetical protein